MWHLTKTWYSTKIKHRNWLHHEKQEEDWSQVEKSKGFSQKQSQMWGKLFDKWLWRQKMCMYTKPGSYIKSKQGLFSPEYFMLSVLTTSGDTGGTFSFCFPLWLRTSLSAGSLCQNQEHKKGKGYLCACAPLKEQFTQKLAFCHHFIILKAFQSKTLGCNTK